MSRPIPKKLAEDMAGKYKNADNISRDSSNSSNPVDRVFDDSVERAMFDDILSSHRRPGSAAAARSTDASFNSGMVKRLRQAEQELFDLQKEHMRLKNYTSILHAENEELKRNASKGANAKNDHIERDIKLARENKALRNQIQDMSQFLSDYGLTWVGVNADAARESLPDVDARHTPEKAKATPSKAFTKFAERVEELNAAIRAEPTQIVTSDKRARFVHAEENVESIKITYYRNGLMVKRGPFRYDDSESYKTFSRDIMDGYFPSELQADNPDGVIIDLQDKSHADYVESAASDDRLTGFQLLKRLPKNIVRNGEIIDIAGEIADKIGHGKQNKPSNIEHAQGFIEPIVRSDGKQSPSRPKEPVHLRYEGSTDTGGRAVTPSKQSANALPTSLKTSSSPLSTSLFGQQDNEEHRENLNDPEIAKIQVKCGNGGPTFVLKMPANSVISELRKMISDYFAKESFDPSQVPQIELRSAFPPRILTDELTMSAAGLVPNGTIHAKLLTSA
jgi:hypothetical protein